MSNKQSIWAFHLIFQENRSKPEARARQVREVANNSCPAEARVHALRKRDVSHHYRPVERT